MMAVLVRTRSHDLGRGAIRERLSVRDRMILFSRNR